LILFADSFFAILSKAIPDLTEAGSNSITTASSRANGSTDPKCFYQNLIVAPWDKTALKANFNRLLKPYLKVLNEKSMVHEYDTKAFQCVIAEEKQYYFVYTPHVFEVLNEIMEECELDCYYIDTNTSASDFSLKRRVNPTVVKSETALKVASTASDITSEGMCTFFL
jgi:hypothetical protein